MKLLREIWDQSMYRRGDENDPRSPYYDSSEEDAFEKWASDYSKQVQHYLTVEAFHTLIGIDPHVPATKSAIITLSKIWESHRQAVVPALMGLIEKHLNSYLEKLWEKHKKENAEDPEPSYGYPDFISGHEPDERVLEIIDENIVDALFNVVNEKNSRGRLDKALKQIGFA